MRDNSTHSNAIFAGATRVCPELYPETGMTGNSSNVTHQADQEANSFKVSTAPTRGAL